MGASYANAKKGEYEVNGNYFYAYSDSFNDEKTARENILPSGRFFTDSESSFQGTTSSNRGAAALEFHISKTMRITVEPSLSVNHTNSFDTSSSISSDESGTVLNTNTTDRTGDGLQRNYSNRFEVLKKLDTIGRYVKAYFNNTNSENNNDTRLIADSRILGDTPSVGLLNQSTTISNKNNEYELGGEYRQPLGNKMFLDFGYEYRNNKRENVRSVFDFDETTATMVVSDIQRRLKKTAPIL